MENESICPRKYHHNWSKERFCRAFGGHNILIMGDSIHAQFYQTLLLINNQNTNKTSIDCSIELQSRSPVYSIVHFFRSHEKDDWQVNLNRNHILTTYNISLLIYNRGMWYSNDTDLVSSMTEFFDFMISKHPNINVVFRSTPVGHPGCMTQFSSEPLENVPTIAEIGATAHPQHHWKEVAMQKEMIQNFIRAKYPRVIYWDVYRMTMLRRDRHGLTKFMLGNDCLHYCFHSVIDSWVIFLTNLVSLFSHESNIT